MLQGMDEMSVETSYALTATLIGVGVLVLVIAFILPRLVSENTEKKDLRK